MRIGIDVRALQEGHRLRGIGIYLTNLLQALDRLDTDHRFLLYQGRGASVATELNLSARFETKHLSQPFQRPVFRRLGNMVRRNIRISPAEADLFLQPDASYGFPEGSVKKVCVLYDVIPLIFRTQYFPSLLKSAKEGFTPFQFAKNRLELILYQWQLRQMAEADAIIAISRCSMNDFVAKCPPVSADRITVIPLAADPRFRQIVNRKRTLSKFTVRQPYFLYVGGIDFRKNVETLLSSYQRARRQGLDAQLVLVGDSFDPLKEIPETNRLLGPYRDMVAEGTIVRIGYIATEELASLYSSATGMIFPSLYEGFGITILEAMACGCPVVAYKNSSIPEVTGNAAMLLQSGDDLASVMIKLMNDSRLRQRLQKRGRIQAKRFSWKTTARQTITLFERIAAS